MTFRGITKVLLNYLDCLHSQKFSAFMFSGLFTKEFSQSIPAPLLRPLCQVYADDTAPSADRKSVV